MDPGRSARVGVAFIILAFSLLGVLPPILAAVRQRRGGSGCGYDDTNHGSTNALLLRIKAFAAGVMLSLSVVHVVYDAFATLSELETAEQYPLYAGYPMGGPFIVFGILWCAPAVLRACCGSCVLAGACLLERARTAWWAAARGHARVSTRPFCSELTRTPARQHVLFGAGHDGLRHPAGGARHAGGCGGA